MGTKIDSEQGKMEGGYSKHGARVFHRLCEEEKEKTSAGIWCERRYGTRGIWVCLGGTMKQGECYGAEKTKMGCVIGLSM